MPTSTALGYNPLFNSGFNGDVSSIQIQSDGKVLVGGNFTTFIGSSQNHLIRLNLNGSKDTSFNISTGFGSSVQSISIQSDGKILAGGLFSTFTGRSQNYLIRLNSDGSKDTSFDIGSGFAGGLFDFGFVLSTAIQSDGKILVGGGFKTYQGVSQNHLIRLNTNGSKDTSFNIGTGFNDSVLSTLIQSDGKVIVGGNFTTFSGVSQNKLIRLNSDGSKDTSFNIGSGFNSDVNDVTIQSDGKILVGGSFTTFTGSSQNRLIRLNSDGSKDTSFNIGTGFSNTLSSTLIQSDGKILVGGAFTTFSGVSQNNLIRLNSDGSKDTSFDIGSGFNGSVNSIVIQSDGKILAGGGFNEFAGSSQNFLIRLNSDGSIASGATTITGTQQIGSLAIATATTVNYSTSTNGGVTFWMGPDEDLGYVIGVPVSGGTQTTPIVGVTAFLGFYRSTLKTEASFVSLVNGTFSQSLTTGASAKTYLTNNGYWTSYV